MQPHPGLQNERTALAWQRTALSVMAGAAALARLTVGRLGPVALLGLVVALPLTLWVLVESQGRYRRDAGGQDRPRARSGRAPACLAVTVAVLALIELAAIVHRH